VGAYLRVPTRIGQQLFDRPAAAAPISGFCRDYGAG